VKFLSDTVVAHGMSVSQLKQAILSELAEKQIMNDVPVNRSVIAGYFNVPQIAVFILIHFLTFSLRTI